MKVKAVLPSKEGCEKIVAALYERRLMTLNQKGFGGHRPPLQPICSQLQGAQGNVFVGTRTLQPDRWSFLKAPSPSRLTPAPPSRGDFHVRISKLIGWPAMLVGLFFAGGCFGERPGNLRTESESIELGAAKSAQVEIKIGVGELRVNGGAKKLLEADFLYNIARWKPQVTYGVSGNQAKLVVKQPGNTGNPWGNVRNEWNLRLSDDVPLDLRVELGVGKSRLEIGSLSLTGLNIQTGVGEVLVDLTGDWKKDLDARIEGGIGELTLRLPNHIGLRIEAEKGIGSIRATGLKKEDNVYVNNAFGKSEVTLRLRIQAGIGEINLELV
jgi:hypothetical protein